MMELWERAVSYGKCFPKYPPVVVSGDWLYGVWFCSRPWRKQEFYGEYPLTYLNRVMSLFPDCRDVLHLFSGSLAVKGVEGTTFDIKSELAPDVVGDVRQIASLLDSDAFDLVIADPPYGVADFEKYGVKPFSKRQCLKDVRKICRGFLVWLDLMIPPFAKIEWRLFGTIAVLTGTNSRVRVASIFERR